MFGTPFLPVNTVFKKIHILDKLLFLDLKPQCIYEKQTTTFQREL